MTEGDDSGDFLEGLNRSYGLDPAARRDDFLTASAPSKAEATPAA